VGRKTPMKRGTSKLTSLSFKYIFAFCQMCSTNYSLFYFGMGSFSNLFKSKCLADPAHNSQVTCSLDRIKCFQSATSRIESYIGYLKLDNILYTLKYSCFSIARTLSSNCTYYDLNRAILRPPSRNAKRNKHPIH